MATGIVSYLETYLPSFQSGLSSPWFHEEDDYHHMMHFKHSFPYHHHDDHRYIRVLPMKLETTPASCSCVAKLSFEEFMARKWRRFLTTIRTSDPTFLMYE